MTQLTEYSPLLTRYNPLLSDSFEDVFKGFFRPVRLGWDEERIASQIKIDVEENEKTYTIRAELPGVKKEDIDIKVEGNMVSIGAEVKREKDIKEDGGRLLRSERYYGGMSRSFSLSQDVDDTKANARYNNGILELTLPKKAGAAVKKLTIQ